MTSKQRQALIECMGHISEGLGAYNDAESMAYFEVAKDKLVGVMEQIDASRKLRVTGCIHTSDRTVCKLCEHL